MVFDKYVLNCFGGKVCFGTWGRIYFGLWGEFKFLSCVRAGELHIST